jgi:hypothetical protein
MKNFFILFVLTLSASAFAQKANSNVKVLSATDGFFFFKTSGNFVGASVEVFDESRNLIAKKLMDGNKLLIDFFDAKAGSYQIEISASNFKHQFNYVLIEDQKEESPGSVSSGILFYENKLRARL